ncbi:MAG: TIGR03790 family protein [Verrucomicrobia bacterium]|nr:TIGR03790 family protein [Verrucomicrobiota bacterium]
MASPGRPAILDRREALFPLGYPMTDAILYFGWYAAQATGVFSDPHFRFSRGAIAVHIHSFSASTIRQADKFWVGPLIRHGAAATLGNVYEPFLQLTPTLDLFYDRLVNGLTFAESAYASLRAVSWMTTIVGDPLYRPFSLDLSAVHSSWQAMELFERESTDRPALMRDLNRVGAVNPTALEIAGLLEKKEGQNDAALETFSRAARGYKKGPEKLRCALHQADLLQSLGRNDELAELIKKDLSRFPDDTSKRILNSYEESNP